MKLLPLLLAHANAAHAEPPQPEMVDVRDHVPDLIVNKPYASEDNFTGKVVYPPSERVLTQVCVMTREAAEKMQVADRHLKANTDGWRFVAWDCLRPESGQQFLWDAYGCNENPGKCAGFIAAPGKSNHQRGRAFDGTLADKDGNLLPAPTEYDHFGALARPANWRQWTESAQKTFSAYYAALQAADCNIIASEWWHADC